MSRTVLSLKAVVSMSAVLGICFGCASWHESKCAKLSPEAAAAIQKAYPAAKVGKATVETEDGVELYEVKLTSNAAEFEAAVTQNGTIMEIETPVSAKDLPQAVTDAVAAAVPGAQIKETSKEEILADAKTGKLATPRMSYVIEVTKDGKEGELTVGADGKVSQQLKWEEQRREKGD